MKDFKGHFKGKKITVMGLGLLGRGVGDVAFLAECGAELIVTDQKTKEVLSESLSKLEVFTNITYVLGEHRMEDFEGKDMILVAAGVPVDSPYLIHAREKGILLVQSAALFAQLSGIPILGITGTRGKSTVTHMIHHVLTEVTEGAPVLLGGNVRGISNLQLLKEVEEDSIAVMELDSWQLQGFGWAKMSPHIAVFTTFMEDHMNYYHHDMNAYFADKANIFKYQEESGVLITTQEVFTRAAKFMKNEGEDFHQELKLVDASVLPEDCLLAMPGEHNRLNAALATEALRATGLTDEEIFASLATFPGVPGRLEYLGVIDLPAGQAGGVKIYNDNNATTPTATIVGLQAVSKGKNVVLIMGGDEKNLDMSGLIQEIPVHCSKVVLFKERGTDRIRDEIFALTEKGVAVYEEEGLSATVARALAVAEPGEVILYSPAFSSFGTHFKNEYDRNDQFVQLIRKAQE